METTTKTTTRNRLGDNKKKTQKKTAAWWDKREEEEKKREGGDCQFLPTVLRHRFGDSYRVEILLSQLGLSRFAIGSNEKLSAPNVLPSRFSRD